MVTQNINVAGATLISVGTGVNGALETLGHTVDMVEPSHQAFYHDVFGDAKGGPQGPPIDIQFLGEIATIRMELSRYDTAVFDKVRQRINPRDAADTLHKLRTVAPATVGTLMFTGAAATNPSFRVLLNPSKAANIATGNTGPMNFLQCIVRAAVEMPHGSKFTSAVIEFEAHSLLSDGTFWNAVTT